MYRSVITNPAESYHMPLVTNSNSGHGLVDIVCSWFDNKSPWQQRQVKTFANKLENIGGPNSF